MMRVMYRVLPTFRSICSKAFDLRRAQLLRTACSNQTALMEWATKSFTCGEPFEVITRMVAMSLRAHLPMDMIEEVAAMPVSEEGEGGKDEEVDVEMEVLTVLKTASSDVPDTELAEKVLDVAQDAQARRFSLALVRAFRDATDVSDQKAIDIQKRLQSSMTFALQGVVLGSLMRPTLVEAKADLSRSKGTPPAAMSMTLSIVHSLLAFLNVTTTMIGTASHVSMAAAKSTDGQLDLHRFFRSDGSKMPDPTQMFRMPLSEASSTELLWQTLRIE